MKCNVFKVLKTKVSALLIIVLIVSSVALVPMTPHGKVQEVEAAFPVTDFTNIFQNTMNAASNAINASLQGSFFLKEFTLDPIFHGLAKMVLKSMTQSILNWINSGFQGSPAFVTDLKQFLLDAADEVVGDFIYNDPSLNFLCSPFQLDIKIALATSYQEQSREGFASEAKCTLSNVTDNVEGFLNGSFSQGGWDSWFEVTQNPVNTPTGAYLAAEAEVYARIVDEQGRSIKELEFGDGFLSFKVCDDTNGAKKNCSISTPGTVIANQINKTLGAGQDELIAADEVNEIISALFAQLAKQAITGINGLLGLGGSQYSDNSYGEDGNSSYLDALRDERNPSSAQNPLIQAILTEEEHYELQTKVLTVVADAEQDLFTQQAANSCTQLNSIKLPRDLTKVGDTAILQRFVSSSTVAVLSDLSTRYQDALDPTEQLAIIEEYNQMQTNGELKSTIDNVRLDLYIKNELATLIDTLGEDIDSAIAECDR